jgi:hypothetical protein
MNSEVVWHMPHTLARYRYFGGYNTFHYTHRLYMPVYALLLIHSEAFYKWAFWPLCMLAVDKAIGHMRAGRKVCVPRVCP